ncbi:MAG: Mut7-C RNAse domain-containing protein [Candidatus Thorarchaeota archaeon]
MSKFYADSMLGKLSRFLRFLGYDTLYRIDEDIESMLKNAIDSNRIILTQARKVLQLSNRKGIKSLMMPTTNIIDQLHVLKQELNLVFQIPPEKMRCSMCNGDLLDRNKNEITDKIPKSTFEYYDTFWECKECGKVFWLGSHWEDIKRTITEVESR